jgi:hypothetical protein
MKRCGRNLNAYNKVKVSNLNRFFDFNNMMVSKRQSYGDSAKISDFQHLREEGMNT